MAYPLNHGALLVPTSGGISAPPAGSATVKVATVAALKALDASAMSAGDWVFVQEYHSGSNVGGGLFVLIDDASVAADEGHVIAPTVASGNKKYRRESARPGYYLVSDFGGRFDNDPANAAANDTAISNLLTALNTWADADPWAPVGAGAKYNGTWGGTVVFDPGFFVISSPIRFLSTALGLTVKSDGFTVIRQHTDNTECFILESRHEPADTMQYLFRMTLIEGFGFTYTNVQDSSDTNSICIAIDNANQTTTAGHSQTGKITRCEFSRCYRGIAPASTWKAGNGGFFSAWEISHLYGRGCVGGLIYLNGLGDSPDMRIVHIYGNYSTTLGDMPIIHVDQFSGLYVDTVEFNDTDLGPIGLRITNCQMVTVKNVMGERLYYNSTHNYNSLVSIESANTFGTVENLKAIHVTKGAGASCFLLRVYGCKSLTAMGALKTRNHSGTGDWRFLFLNSGATARLQADLLQDTATVTLSATTLVAAGPPASTLNVAGTYSTTAIDY
jgi:hypothetical protein